MVRCGSICARPSVHCMDKALRAAPEGLELILMGYLNMRLGYPRGKREEYLVTRTTGGVGLEGRCHRGQYQAGVTEHLDGEGKGTGDGTTGAPAGERGCGFPTGEKVDAGHLHP